MEAKTLEQKRALYAWNVIDKLKKAEAFGNDRILSLFRRLPAMIMHNGLITATSFLKSKSISKGKIKEEGAVLYALENYLVYRLEHNGDLPTDAKGIENIDKRILEDTHARYIKELLNMEFPLYRVEAMEALYIAQWLKRIAEGEIEDEGKGSD